MRKLSTVLLASAVLSLPLYADGPTGTEAPQESTRDELIARIEQLEQRIAALEKRGALPLPDEDQVPAPPAQPSPPVPPSFVPRLAPSVPSTPELHIVPHGSAEIPRQLGEPVPKGWKQFEFNGQTYYWVPVDGQR